jgi:uncharacterized protein YqeY
MDAQAVSASGRVGQETATVLRDRLNGALKDAMESGEPRAAATLRLIQAALRERDHCARATGVAEGLSEEEIRGMLRDMIAQRREEIVRCEACARVDVAEQEAEEIAIIEQFLPPRMSDAEISSAVSAAIKDLGASRLKDTGRVIAALKQRYNGQMDFTRAKRILCERLH